MRLIKEITSDEFWIPYLVSVIIVNFFSFIIYVKDTNTIDFGTFLSWTPISCVLIFFVALIFGFIN